ncbi:hypothetical protein GY15_22920 [Delftia sp. 670]|nr:hypothetical protein GY15_22920 [Delftia sp. 670]
MSAQAEDGDVGPGGDRLLGADAVFRGAADDRDAVYGREAAPVVGIAVGVGEGQLALPPGDAGQRLVTLDQGQGVEEAALAQQDALHLGGDFDRAADDVDHGGGRCIGSGAGRRGRKRGGGQQGGGAGCGQRQQGAACGETLDGCHGVAPAQKDRSRPAV